MIAREPMLGPGQLWRRAAAWGVTLMAASVAGIGPGMAAPQDDVFGPATLVSNIHQPVTSTITSVAPSYLSASSSLNLKVDLVAGPTGATGVSTTVSLTTAPLTSAHEVDAFLAQPQAVASRVVYRSGSTDEQSSMVLPAHSSTPLTITIPAEDLALASDFNGVIGTVVTTRASGMEPVSHPLIIAVVNSPLPQLDTAVVATISGNPGRVAALLGAAADPRTALVADPLALALLPEPASLDGREVYLLPAAHLDITSVAHADQGEILDFALARNAASAWAGSPWLAFPGVLDSGVVDAVSSRGATAVFASTRMESGWPAANVVTTPVVVSSTETGSSIPTVLTHQRLSQVLAGSSVNDAVAPARLVAESVLVALSLANHDTTGQDAAGTVVLAPGDQWIVDGSRPSPELAALYATPWIHPITVEAVLSEEAPPVKAAPDAVASPRDIGTDLLVAVSASLRRLETLAQATDQPEAVLSTYGHSLLSPLSLPMRADPQGRAVSVEAKLETTAETLDGVRVTSSSEVTLISTSGRIPVTVRNDLPYRVTVVLTMTSSSPNLLIDDLPTVTLEPLTDQTVLVPITAVSNDDVVVTVALRTVDGDPLTTSQRFYVRVRAAWGNAATGVFTAGLVVLLLAGIYRTVKRGRRDTRLGPIEEPVPESAP